MTKPTATIRLPTTLSYEDNKNIEAAKEELISNGYSVVLLPADTELQFHEVDMIPDHTDVGTQGITSTPPTYYDKLKRQLSEQIVEEIVDKVSSCTTEKSVLIEKIKKAKDGQGRYRGPLR